jgi:hypothetical protein
MGLGKHELTGRGKRKEKTWLGIDPPSHQPALRPVMAAGQFPQANDGRGGLVHGRGMGSKQVSGAASEWYLE